MSHPELPLTHKDWETLAKDAETVLRLIGQITPYEEDDETMLEASELQQSLSDRLKACHTQALHSEFFATTPKEASDG